MSAGGVTYDGIYPKRMTTLPSVETWGNNMNILKDPPKSIHTYKKDKISDVQRLIHDQEEASDRICEMINVYPRGQNPFVNVQYSNSGTAGGQNRQIGSSGSVSSGGSAFTGNTSVGIGTSGIGGVKLPYGVMTDGDFRPPVRSQYDELPLSRLPRAWTYATTNKGGKKKLLDSTNCSDEKTYNQAIKKCDNLPVNRGGPSYVYKVDKAPQRETYNVKNTIKDSIHNNVNTIKTGEIRDNYNRNMPTRGIVENPEHFEYNAPKGSDVLFRTVNNSNRNVNEYVNDSLQGNYNSNRSAMPKDVIERSDINTSRNIQNKINTSANSNIYSKYGGEQFMEVEDLTLERNQPIAQATTNASGGYNPNNKHENDIRLNRNLPVYSSNSASYGVGDTTQNNGREFGRLKSKVDRNQEYSNTNIDHMPNWN